MCLCGVHAMAYARVRTEIGAGRRRRFESPDGGTRKGGGGWGRSHGAQVVRLVRREGLGGRGWWWSCGVVWGGRSLFVDRATRM